MKKPKINRIAKAAKEDLKALETAMNSGIIAERNPGEEIVAKTEGGASVTITAGGKTVTTTTEKLADLSKRVVKGVKFKSQRGKPVQTEASALIPELDGVGKAANRFAAVIKSLAELSEEKGDAESKLIAALRRAKRTSIKVEGYAFFLNHKGPVDKIQVQKPK